MDAMNVHLLPTPVKRTEAKPSGPVGLPSMSMGALAVAAMMGCDPDLPPPTVRPDAGLLPVESVTIEVIGPDPTRGLE